MPEKGMERRAVVGRPLQQAGQKQLASVPQAPLMGVGTPQVQVTDRLSDKMLNDFRDFIGRDLKIKLGRDAETARARGAMQHAQGGTLEDMLAQGDPVMTEGWRIVAAQTASAELLATQEASIESEHYASSPEAYAEHMSRELTSALDAAPDEITRRMLEANLSEKLPVLAATQMRASMRHREQTAFDALSGSVGQLASDPTSHEALVDFAIGAPGSATADMPPARRQLAVANGIVDAFERDNPMAYTVLASSGALDDVPVAQRRAIRAARASFEARARERFDAETFAELQGLDRRIASGELEPAQALEEYTRIWAENGVRVSMTEGGRIFAAARDASQTRHRLIGTQIEEARLRGDFGDMADLLFPSLTLRESGNNPEAQGPVITAGENAGDRAQGIAQVMPRTLRDPGFGVVPARDDSAAELARVGHDYLEAMLTRYGGDVEAALIAYNAGPGNADKWLEAGRDYSSLPKPEETQPYVRDILRHAGSAEDTATDLDAQLRLAEERRKQAEGRLRLDRWASIQPELADLDAQRERGDLTFPEWIAQRSTLYRTHGVERDRAVIEAEMDVYRGVLKDAGDQMDAAQRYRAERAIDRSMLEYTSAEEAYKAGRLSEEDYLGVVTRTREAVPAAFEEAGVQLDIPYMTERDRAMDTRVLAAMRARRELEERRAAVSAASFTGSVYTAPQAVQDQAIRDTNAEIAAAVQAQLASGEISGDPAAGVSDEQAAAGVAQQARIDAYSERGILDPQMQRAWTGALTSGSLVDDKGQPSPAAIAAVLGYARMRGSNQGLADRYLSPEAAGVMATILQNAGEDLSQQGIASAIIQTQAGPRRGGDPRALARTPEFQDAISATVQDYVQTQDIGTLQAWFWENADRDQWYDRNAVDVGRINSEQVEDALRAELETEVAAILSTDSGQSMDRRAVVADAARRLKNRVALIGGSEVMAPRGQDLFTLTFGADADSFRGQADAVNREVTHTVRTLADMEPAELERLGLPQYLSSADETSLWETADPMGIVGSLFGESSTYGQGTALSTWITGVRPYRAVFWTDQQRGAGLKLYISRPGAADAASGEGSATFEEVFLPFELIRSMGRRRRIIDQTGEDPGMPTLLTQPMR